VNLKGKSLALFSCETNDHKKSHTSRRNKKNKQDKNKKKTEHIELAVYEFSNDPSEEDSCAELKRMAVPLVIKLHVYLHGLYS